MSMERQQRLEHLHNMLVQLIMHEGRFISERTNNFLLYNSFFFAGFIILMTQVQDPTAWSLAISALISFIGILFSGLHILVIGQNISSANFWRSTVGIIEEDSDFWWPQKTDGDTDLDFFHARIRHLQGNETRQRKASLNLGGLAIWNKHRSLAPNSIFGMWLPIIMGSLWLSGFIWVLVEI